MVSFGEFVTLIWNIDDKRKSGAFALEGSIKETNIMM
jgi:hypothetical protein